MIREVLWTIPTCNYFSLVFYTSLPSLSLYRLGATYLSYYAIPLDNSLLVEYFNDNVDANIGSGIDDLFVLLITNYYISLPQHMILKQSSKVINFVWKGALIILILKSGDHILDISLLLFENTWEICQWLVDWEQGDFVKRLSTATNQFYGKFKVRSEVHFIYIDSSIAIDLSRYFCPNSP